MATDSRNDLIDLITTIFLLIIAIAGLYMSLEFPGRSGMWPTFVLVALLVSAGVHLFNIFRKLRQPKKEVFPDTGHQNEG